MSSDINSLSLAVDQQVSQVNAATPPNPGQGSNLFSGLGNESSLLDNMADSAKGVGSDWANIDAPVPTGDGDATRPPTEAEKNARRVGLANDAVNTLMTAINLPLDMINLGFADLTAPLAALWPEMPAATLLSLYIGVPHAHDHPPSADPIPIPLPSLGPVLFGTCVQVLINYLPAARAGDIGLAPTCGGFFPFFEIKTGSSNVFIGGSRAARMGDICMACFPAGDERANEAEKAESKVAKIAEVAEKAIQGVGYAASGLTIASDLASAAVIDDSVDDGAAMKQALVISAAMTAAQLAADLIAMALTKEMGKDPAITPAFGAIVLGHPNVLIGGFPMINFPNPIEFILNRLKHYKGKSEEPHEKEKENKEKESGFKTCEH